MAFTNSPLVVYTRISPNRNSPRNHAIDRITIHHMAGVCSVEDFGNIVAPTSRQMSANYAIGNDGRIGLFCPESDRSWCSSSPLNDHRAITIEVSNSSIGGDWPIGDRAYKSLIKLCVDICKRNGIKKLYYDGLNGTLTRHCDLWPTACPGPWMKNHTTDLCNKVNAQLNSSSSVTKPQPTTSFKVGDLVKINAGARYYGGGAIPQWVANEKWYISSISGDRAVLGLNEAKNRNIQSPINTKDITLVKTQTTSTFKEYTKSFKGTDKIYGTAGGSVTGTIGASGIYTIVEEKTVGTVTYGKLKSGKGWVIVRQQDVQIKKGDVVSIKADAVYYDGSQIPSWVKNQKWYVDGINGDRAVLGKNISQTQNIQSPINKKYLHK